MSADDPVPGPGSEGPSVGAEVPGSPGGGVNQVPGGPHLDDLGPNGRMDQVWKRLWVAALRSGRFTQGRNRLKLSGRHCCLGVLCEVAALSQREETVDLVGTVAFFSAGRSSSSQHLPDEFAWAVSLSKANQDRLTFMNDSAGFDFLRIAGWIEENL